MMSPLIILSSLVRGHPGINFTNILCVAFMCADPKSAKIHTGNLCCFALLESAHVKADCKLIVDIDPWAPRPARSLDFTRTAFESYPCQLP